MKYSPLLSVFAILIATTMACQSKKFTDPSSAEIEKINISYGGGFAGTYEYYTLLKNGQVFHWTTHESEPTELKSIDKKDVKAVFDLHKKLALDEAELDDPGNMTYSLTHINKGEDKKYKWNENTKDARKINILYKLVRQKITPGNPDQNKSSQLKVDIR